MIARRLVKLLELTQVDAATLSIKLQAATIIGILAMRANCSTPPDGAEV